MGLQESKHRVVCNWIVDSMSNGGLKLGARLPSENELSQRFQLSRQAIRYAIDLLEQQKPMIRIRGSGAYMGGEGKLGCQEWYMNIAVISTYMDSCVFLTVLREIESVLSQRGYTTQIAFTSNWAGREQEILGSPIDEDMIDGPVVEPIKGVLPNPNLRCHRELMSRHVPVLFFSCICSELGLPFMAVDGVSVGRKVVEYLMKAGYRKIGDIFKCDSGQGPLRYKGFTQGIEEAGLKVKDKSVVRIDSEDMVEMEYWSDYLFRRIGGYTVVVCYNDKVVHILFGTYEKRGISILDQLSLVGTDNSELSTLAEVPITSLPYPMEELGRKTAEDIVKMIENPCFGGNHHFDLDVTGRGSVKLIKDDGAKQ